MFAGTPSHILTGVTNMRAETQAIIDQIRESLALLRRHL